MGDIFSNPFDGDGIKKVTIEEYYGSRQEDYTADGLWSATELAENLADEVYKIIPLWKRKNEHVAVINRDLLHDDILCEYIKDKYVLIEEYNRAASIDRHRFGISQFDEWICNTIMKILNENKVVR